MSLRFQHVDLLHADGGLGFQKEYDYIQAATAEKKGDYSYRLQWSWWLCLMFNNIGAQGEWKMLMNNIILAFLANTSDLWSFFAGKLEDSNNLTWVDGYQNKNAYVMTNIYR